MIRSSKPRKRNRTLRQEVPKFSLKAVASQRELKLEL